MNKCLKESKKAKCKGHMNNKAGGKKNRCSGW